MGSSFRKGSTFTRESCANVLDRIYAQSCRSQISPSLFSTCSHKRQTCATTFEGEELYLATFTRAVFFATKQILAVCHATCGLSCRIIIGRARPWWKCVCRCFASVAEACHHGHCSCTRSTRSTSPVAMPHCIQAASGSPNKQLPKSMCYCLKQTFERKLQRFCILSILSMEPALQTAQKQISKTSHSKSKNPPSIGLLQVGQHLVQVLPRPMLQFPNQVGPVLSCFESARQSVR